jgi:hypothetical protein
MREKEKSERMKVAGKSAGRRTGNPSFSERFSESHCRTRHNDRKKAHAMAGFSTGAAIRDSNGF